MPIPRSDKLFFISFAPFALSVIGILIVFIHTTLYMSSNVLFVHGLSLLWENAWNPEHEVYGLSSAIIGTFAVSLIATLLAISLSIPLSITLAEFLKGKTRDILSSLVELMGGMPTVIYAAWSLQYLLPLIKEFIMIPLHQYLGFIPLFSCKPLTGLSILSAGIALGISLIPFTTSIVIESYKMIPMTYREAALGIGATRYESVKITLSIARPAILASAILSYARASGETTIAVTTVGNSLLTNMCLLAPGYTIPALIASQYANASLYRYAEGVLYLASLIVLLSTIVLSFIGLRLLDKWRRSIIV